MSEFIKPYIVVRPNKEGVFPKLQINPVFYGDIAIGNGTQYKFFIGRVGVRSIMVGIMGKGMYEFNGLTTVGYVKEKLNLRFDNDAANVTDLINDQLYPGSDREGTYEKQFCEDYKNEQITTNR